MLDTVMNNARRSAVIAAIAAAGALSACATTSAGDAGAGASEDAAVTAEAPAPEAVVIVEGVPVTCAGDDLAAVQPPFASLTTIAPVQALIKSYEQLSLQAIVGPGGELLIGYGHTGGGVTPGMTITEAQADALFASDLKQREKVVKASVTAPMTRNEFSAFVDFTYNLGEGNFRRSTLLRKFNAGDREGAAEEFPRWNKIAGQPNSGLTTRRAIERAIYLCQGEAAVVAAE